MSGNNQSKALNHIRSILEAEDEYVYSEDLYGVFQQFRPTGLGVERLFQLVPNGPEYVNRLKRVYSSTNDSNDAYFIVRNPSPASEEELASIGKGLLHNLQFLSQIIGDSSLSNYLSKELSVELARRDHRMKDTGEYTPVYETIGDWLNSNTDFDDAICVFNEAYYSIACDYWLSWYLQWPYFKHLCSTDVFEPYFDLWRLGCSIWFGSESLKITHEYETLR